MSPPAEKARPAPVITSARSSDGGSCDSCATEACTASPISTVMAFRLSGRSSVNTLTPLCSSSSTRTAVLSFCTCGTARKQAVCSGGRSLDERISMAATPAVAPKRGTRSALARSGRGGRRSPPSWRNFWIAVPARLISYSISSSIRSRLYSGISFWIRYDSAFFNCASHEPCEPCTVCTTAQASPTGRAARACHPVHIYPLA